MIDIHQPGPDAHPDNLTWIRTDPAMNETPAHAHEANLIPSSEAPLFDGHSMKVACSNCNLRELCMPVGLSPQLADAIRRCASSRVSL